MNLSRGLRTRQLDGKHDRTLNPIKQFVETLDLAHELEGHAGCVNALDWSSNGRFLASGSDDRRVIIWDTYTPGNKIAKDIHTGHTRNIFSVKFSPGNRDRTLITAAGDKQIRVFDVEYGSSSATVMHEPCQRQVYRAHVDRVKRIVVEDAGHCFLSCSEDGDVRQFDLREHNREEYRSPLLSYAQYQIDLNTIALNQRNPYLLAVGGTHPCAFLHDRRMAGRDMVNEWGTVPVTDTPTQCVRKFRSGRREAITFPGEQITALRFGSENPRDLICSWLNDDIYLFDIHGQGHNSNRSTIATNTAQKSTSNGVSQKRKRSQSPSRNESTPRELKFESALNKWQILNQTREFLFAHPRIDFDREITYQNFLLSLEMAKLETETIDAEDIEQYILDCRMFLGGLVNDDTLLQVEEVMYTWQSHAIRRIVLACCSTSTDPTDDSRLGKFLLEDEDTPIRGVTNEESEILFLSHTALIEKVNTLLESKAGLTEMKTPKAREYWIERVCLSLLKEQDSELTAIYSDEKNRLDWRSEEDFSLDESDSSDQGYDLISIYEEDEEAQTELGGHSQAKDDNESASLDAHPDVSTRLPQRSFSGHVNVETIKDVNFLGSQDEYVMSGSDDGIFFIWNKSTGQIVKMLYGDADVVNVMEANPSCTSLAVSGIEDTVKIFQAFEFDAAATPGRPFRGVYDSEYEIRARNKARLISGTARRERPFRIPRGMMGQLAEQYDIDQECRLQ